MLTHADCCIVPQDPNRDLEAGNGGNGGERRGSVNMAGAKNVIRRARSSMFAQVSYVQCTRYPKIIAFD